MQNEHHERFWRALADTAPPPLDEERGRARFLAAQRALTLRQGRRSWSRGIALAAAAALSLGLAAALVVPRPLTFTTGDAGGQVGAWLATDTVTEMPLAFSDGTRVVLQQDSRGRVEHVDRRGARMVLERGKLHAEVTHRVGTDFRFVAGPFEVLVTGTALSVAWDPLRESFRVSVQSGSVLVHGPYIGSDQVVRAGEHCHVDMRSKTMQLVETAPGPDAAKASAAPDPPPDPAPDPEREDAAVASQVPPAPRAVAEPPRKPAHAVASFSALAQEGRYEEAFAAAERAGLASLYRTASADELMHLAQVGQLSGHPDVEHAALVACRKRFAGSPQAALSAYQLGRTAPPGEAASWFEAYLREQPAGPLAREALGRLVEAYELSGNDEAARGAATSYLARYPSGPHAQRAQRVLARVRGKEGP